MQSGDGTDQTAPQRNRHPRRLPHCNREHQPLDPRAQAAELQTHHAEEVRTLKDLVVKQDLEMESVRKELQSIQKQLDNQAIRHDGLKKTSAPPS